MKINQIRFTNANSIYVKKMNNKQDMELKTKDYSTNSVLQSYPANFYVNNFVSFKGNNELIGYDKEKEKIQKLLIDPIKEGSDNVPSGFVLYAEDSKTGAKFINSIANQIDANVEVLHPQTRYLDSEIYDCLEKIKNNYLNTGKRTILVVKGSTNYLTDNPMNNENVSELCNYILDVASKKPSDYSSYDAEAATTIIFETRTPQRLSSQFLDKVSGIIALPVRSKYDMVRFIKSELEKNKIYLPDDEFKFLTEKINFNSSEDLISNTIKEVKPYYGSIRDWDYFAEHENLSQFHKGICNIIGVNGPIRGSYLDRKASNKAITWLAKNKYIDKELGIANKIENKLEELLEIQCEKFDEPEITNELSDKEAENSALITSISDFEAKSLKDVMIGDTYLVDFWLDLENSELDKNRIKNNDRLKNIWFDKTIKDEEKVKNFISITLDKLQNENELIKTARESYKDIIENDTTITDNQKEILVKQQESLLFFKVISNKLNADDILEMEVNILDTLEQLENEKTSIKENAINNIFTPVRNSAVLTSENAEDIENSEYIISLVEKALQNNNFRSKERLNVAWDNFSQGKLSTDNSWNEIVDIAQEYFETAVLDDITNRNIELLNSINEKVSDDDSKKIKNLTKDKIYSIEQREFIARHKDDNNFKVLLNNQNIDIKSIIKDLVFFESSNKALLEENYIDEESINFAQIMSDKFKQINNENKDIKIQTDRVLDKLGEIETTISDFSSNFNSFANDMLDIEIDQLQQITMGNDYLYAISNNTKEIKEYSKALTKAKLVELGKDKYYKDIIPEITKLLPDDEQFNLKDFMQKVETLAKQEKDSKRKKTIIKAGVAVAGTLAVGACVYYFWPQIVAHLASKLPVAQVGLAANEVIKSTNVAKKIGNSQLVSFKAHRPIWQIECQIKNIEASIENKKKFLEKYPNASDTALRLKWDYQSLERVKEELKRALKEDADEIKRLVTKADSVTTTPKEKETIVTQITTKTEVLNNWIKKAKDLLNSK